MVSMDDDAGPGDRLFAEAVDHPEGSDSIHREFDRQWAKTVFARSFSALEEECGEKGQGQLFVALRPVLTGEDSIPISQLASELGMNDNAVSVALHRLRKRLSELIRSEVAETLLPDDDLAEEIRYLASVL